MADLVSFLVFGGAAALSVFVIAYTVAPEWRRILDILSHGPQPAFAPLSELVQAERRIAVRRWSAAFPATASPLRWREAA